MEASEGFGSGVARRRGVSNVMPQRTACCAVSIVVSPEVHSVFGKRLAIVAQPAQLVFQSFVAGVLAHDGRRVFEHLQGAATPADELLPIHEAGLAATAGGDQKVPFRLRHLKLALSPLATVLRETGIGLQTPLEQAGGLVFQIVPRARSGMVLSKPRDPADQFRAVIAEDGRGHARLGGRPLQGLVNVRGVGPLGRHEGHRLQVRQLQRAVHRQTARPNSQDQQHLLWADLDRVIEEPDPVRRPFLRTTQWVATQPQQPGPSGGPIRGLGPTGDEFSQDVPHGAGPPQRRMRRQHQIQPQRLRPGTRVLGQHVLGQHGAVTAAMGRQDHLAPRRLFLGEASVRTASRACIAASSRSAASAR